MKYLAIALIKFYRKFLSPLKRHPTCRFTPTCSAYAIEAYSKRGFIAGTILTVRRILRCNPFCAGGYDPVPEHGFRYTGECGTGFSLTGEDGDECDPGAPEPHGGADAGAAENTIDSERTVPPDDGTQNY